jgi:hypothetical protein
VPLMSFIAAPVFLVSKKATTIVTRGDRVGDRAFHSNRHLINSTSRSNPHGCDAPQWEYPWNIPYINGNKQVQVGSKAQSFQKSI